MKTEQWLPTLWGDSADPRDPFNLMRRQMDNMLDTVWGGGRPAKPVASGMLSPRVDVSETDKELRVTAELPGVEQKDLTVTLTGDVLTIKGEKRSETETKPSDPQATYHRIERSYGSFQRTMSVPYDIDPAKVDAKFKDGVLTITLPKPVDVQRQAKKIEIKTAA